MNLFRWLAALYSGRYPIALTYMLQNVEYRAGPYLAWYWRTNDFASVMYRRELHRTKAARLLLMALRLGMFLQAAIGLTLIIMGIQGDIIGGWAFGLAVLLSYPVVWAHLVVVPLVLGRILVIEPRQRILVMESRRTFVKFDGLKIAVAGSYGKTSMKELLSAVLGKQFKVAATPGNLNVPISHARFADALDGDEDILIIEYGEGAPGDVPRFAHTTQPEIGIITGLAAAHLDRYKTVQKAGQDIFALADFVPSDALFVNAESEASKPFIKKTFQTYDRHGTLGWKVSNVKVSLKGTSFTLKKGKQQLELKTKLVGEHHIGPLAFAAALADKLGVNSGDIQKTIAQTAPFEHRMQPYQLNGAWIIDDTYNGNIEGIRAGTELLKTLPARRKIYVTPGLVDQGDDSAQIHQQMGQLIASAKPDIVVLMQHSVTPDIQKGLADSGFKGEVLVESDPLNFYQNLHSFVASGDVALMQNDWPDNYQ